MLNQYVTVYICVRCMCIIYTVSILYMYKYMYTHMYRMIHKICYSSMVDLIGKSFFISVIGNVSAFHTGRGTVRIQLQETLKNGGAKSVNNFKSRMNTLKHEQAQLFYMLISLFISFTSKKRPCNQTIDCLGFSQHPYVTG